MRRKMIFCLLISGALLLGLSPAGGQEGLTVKYVDVSDEEFPVEDPTSVLWESETPLRVNVLPQMITNPMLMKPTVPWIDVKALHNGSWVAFLLQWPDPTRDANVDVDIFTDAVAIELPMSLENPISFTMGNPGGLVHIIHWKALWQKDIDEGFQDVRKLHPNYWVDLYFFAETPLPIFAEGEFPHSPAARSFKTPEALAQLPGAYVRNPISMLERKVPVEEASAEGFGTMTSQPKQNAKGRGIWTGEGWEVVISRPLVTDDSMDAELSPGNESLIAFAVWNGGDQNVGARKHYTPWVKLEMEEVK